MKIVYISIFLRGNDKYERPKALEDKRLELISFVKGLAVKGYSHI